MPNTYSLKKNIYQFASLFSVIRGYNILVLILAQYLASIFIFSPQKSILQVVLDSHLLFIVLASVCVVASGYIINNFYDVKMDKINRPIKTRIDGFVSQKTKLNIYFLLNFLGFVFGYIVSWRAALFFSIYIFFIWFYSHKLKKYPFIGLFTVTVLTILPFFATFVYFKNFSTIIFVHAIFLFLLLMIRELVKDLANIKGAIVNNYRTFPIRYGEKWTKKLVIILSILLLIPIWFLFKNEEIGYMKYYFFLVIGTLFFLSFYLIKETEKKHYLLMHNALKMVLLIGIFSLLLIKPSLILDKIQGLF